MRTERNLKEQGFYHSTAWRKVRLQVLQRDHYLCQVCIRKKRITPATEVHHRKPLKDNPTMALVLDNLESLCWDCHEATKQWKQRPPIPARVIKINDGSGEERG